MPGFWEIAFVVFLGLVMWLLYMRQRRAEKSRAGQGKGTTASLVHCDICDSYVPQSGSESCTRADCPHSARRRRGA